MIKTPLPDDVFQKWLNSKSSGEIEKHFGRKPNEISPMEVVGKEIRKSPALVFKSNVSATTQKKSSDPELFSYKEAEKQKYYKFKGPLRKEDWNEKETKVFLFSSLQETSCKECGKKGTKKCDKCGGNGLLVCDNCKDDKNIRCKECKGDRSIVVKFEIYNEENKKTETKEQKIPCPNCHGQANFICESCGGSKKLVCKNCYGAGGTSCKTCEGTGIMFMVPKTPVPMSKSQEIYFFWDDDMTNAMEKSKAMKGIELIDTLAKQNIKSIQIKDTDDLSEKKLEPQLGFWSKDANRQIKDCKKSFESLKKGKVEIPHYPIELYPLIKIDVETYKKKKFTIYSIGSQEGYIVFDLGL